MGRALLCVMAMVGAMRGEEKVKLPATRADLQAGEKLFKAQCGRCHGPRGEGSVGPSLTRAKLSHAPDDGTLVKILDEGIRGTEMPGADAMSAREIRQTAAYVRSLGKVPQQAVPGDPEKGAALYRGKGCASCHSIQGDGGVVGPDLARIGETRSAAYLRESLVSPEATVPEGYQLVTVVSKNGPTVTGVRVNEDSFSIQVRESSGRSYSFWKSDVARIEKPQKKSPMPSYQGQLAEAELTDLVAYLASLKERK